MAKRVIMKGKKTKKGWYETYIKDGKVFMRKLAKNVKKRI